MTTIPLPRHLLLATDLSPRCDRALERAALLAQGWQAALTVLSVLDAPRAPDQILAWLSDDRHFDPEQDTREQLTQTLGHLQVPADIRLEQGQDAPQAIVDTARAVAAGLVVTGVARDEPLGRFLLGSSVERLARTLEQPLLIVRNRPLGAYRRVVAATDLSPGSRAALRTAAHWFTASEVDVFHAAAATAPIRVSEPGFPRDANPAVLDRCERFVNDSGVPRARFSRVVAVEAALEVALTRYVRRRGADLVVMGAHESEGWLDALRATSLHKVLQWMPADVLVVPDAPGD